MTDHSYAAGTTQAAPSAVALRVTAHEVPADDGRTVACGHVSDDGDTERAQVQTFVSPNDGAITIAIIAIEPGQHIRVSLNGDVVHESVTSRTSDD